MQTPTSSTIIVGHRGARQEAPENTLDGFRLLRSLNIHHVELDLHLSKDNQLVVVHDKTVDRTTAHSGYVSDFTAANLAKMNAAHHFPNWDCHSGIPLLDEILAEWQELKSIQLEVKPPNKEQFSMLAQELTNHIQRHQLD
ncbi:MAG: glycerophosphodiester phosphodiesterase, partial [Pseudomonadales bacterium]|nr:glycerophosphodiester phosphodiesterase [Pseudomonadales bacterium]